MSLQLFIFLSVGLHLGDERHRPDENYLIVERRNELVQLFENVQNPVKPITALQIMIDDLIENDGDGYHPHYIDEASHQAKGKCDFGQIRCEEVHILHYVYDFDAHLIDVKLHGEHYDRADWLYDGIDECELIDDFVGLIRKVVEAHLLT